MPLWYSNSYHIHNVGICNYLSKNHLVDCVGAHEAAQFQSIALVWLLKILFLGSHPDLHKNLNENSDYERRLIM